MIRIDPEKNEIVVGPKSKLGKKEIDLRNINLLDEKSVFNNKIKVKVRSTGKLLDATVNIIDQKNAKVNLDNFENGISPGQACVFYKPDQYGERILGGGWIT